MIDFDKETIFFKTKFQNVFLKIPEFNGLKVHYFGKAWGIV